LGVNINGGFAEFSSLPASQAHKLSANISFNEAALVEPVACCIHGIELIGIAPGETVFILGAGTVGLIMLQLARLAEAGYIIVSEPSGFKRRLAQELGADKVVNPTEGDFFKYAADLVIECAGVPMTIRQSFNLVKDGGRILFFGLCGSEVQISIHPQEIVKRELRLQGSVLNPYTHPQALKLIAEKKVKVFPLITQKFSLSKIEEAFKIHKYENAVKVLII